MVILNWKQKLITDRKTFYFKSNVKGKPNNIWNWSAQFLLALIKIMTKAMAKIIIKVTNKSIFSDILREDERREPAPWPLGNLSRSSGGASNIIIIIIIIVLLLIIKNNFISAITIAIIIALPSLLSSPLPMAICHHHYPGPPQTKQASRPWSPLLDTWVSEESSWPSLKGDGEDGQDDCDQDVKRTMLRKRRKIIFSGPRLRCSSWWTRREAKAREATTTHNSPSTEVFWL